MSDDDSKALRFMREYFTRERVASIRDAQREARAGQCSYREAVIRIAGVLPVSDQTRELVAKFDEDEAFSAVFGAWRCTSPAGDVFDVQLWRGKIPQEIP